MNDKAALIRLAALLLIMLCWSFPGFCGQIHDAVKNGNLAKAKTMLKGNPKLISSKDGTGRIPLHWACSKDVAELLLANNSDVNAMSKDLWTPLHMAAANGCYKPEFQVKNTHYIFSEHLIYKTA
jgi:ankyrin repeat protein